MGGSKSRKCNDVAKLIWAYCIDSNIWISAAHIPGKTNLVADKMSHQFNDNTEWKLCPTVYKEIGKILTFSPEIYLFASWKKNQAQKTFPGNQIQVA